MYRDIALWARVRTRTLSDGNSISAVCKAEGICPETARAMLPLPYRPSIWKQYYRLKNSASYFS